MLSTLLIVLPVFALIFIGWVARRMDILGPSAMREINRFVVYLALPALLLDVVAGADWGAIWHPGFVAAFGLAIAVIFILTIGLRRASGRPLADAAIDGLNASYGNAAYVGFPLTLATIGPQGMPLTLVGTILTATVLFAVAIILIEIDLQETARPLDIARKVVGSLLRNPLIIAPLLGVVLAVLRVSLPAPVESVLKLLGGTAAPCALVSLGLFLAAERVSLRTLDGATLLLSTLKLLALPLATWALVTWLFRPPALIGHVAILLATLPTGTGAFMLAELYGREARVTGQVVLVTTVLSVLTISAYLSMIR